MPEHNPGFHVRRQVVPNICPRCGDHALYGQLCRLCSISQIPYAGYIFAKRPLENVECWR